MTKKKCNHSVEEHFFATVLVLSLLAILAGFIGAVWTEGNVIMWWQIVGTGILCAIASGFCCAVASK